MHGFGLNEEEMCRALCHVEGRREIRRGFWWGNMKERTTWKTRRCGWEDNIIDCPKPVLWSIRIWSVVLLHRNVVVREKWTCAVLSYPISSVSLVIMFCYPLLRMWGWQQCTCEFNFPWSFNEDLYVWNIFCVRFCGSVCESCCVTFYSFLVCMKWPCFPRVIIHYTTLVLHAVVF